MKTTKTKSNTNANLNQRVTRLLMGAGRLVDKLTAEFRGKPLEQIESAAQSAFDKFVDTFGKTEGQRRFQSVKNSITKACVKAGLVPRGHKATIRLKGGKLALNLELGFSVHGSRPEDKPASGNSGETARAARQPVADMATAGTSEPIAEQLVMVLSEASVKLRVKMIELAQMLVDWCASDGSAEFSEYVRQQVAAGSDKQ
jgi:hypothetical protein